MGKREQERIKPRFLMNAINVLDEQILGSVVNVSEGGFMLSSHGGTIPDRAIFQVRLKEEQSNMEINLGAACLWQTEANAADSYWTGFQIIDISPEDEAMLKSYIEDLRNL